MFDKIAVPGGTIHLRPARPGDDAFLFELFRDYSTGVLKLGRLSDQKIDELLTTQFASRTRSFRERFPRASWSIVELAGAPIGELIVDEDANTICIIDIALRPEYQRQGIGSAIVRALAAAAGEGGLSAMVLMTNATSLSMFRRLGFADTGHDNAYIELRWRP